MIQEIIKKSSLFDDKNKELIKKEGVVFTDKNICDRIIYLIKPSINENICEPSVGKGAFVFSLLEYFRNNGETIESIVYFVENKLWCFDINPEFISELKTLLNEYFNLLGYNNSLNLKNIICEDFLFQDMNWDVVFGNPPYVRIQNLDKNYLNEIKGNLKSLSLGNIDLYYAFIEKSLLSSKRVGFIIPNTFIKNKSGKFLRQILIDNINYLYDFNNEKVWQSISTYTCIVILGEKTTNFNYVTSKINLIKDKSELSDDIWLFTEQNKGNNKLSNLVNYCSGSIATIKDDVFKMDSFDKDFCFKNNSKIEKGICKKIIKATKDRNFEDYKYIIYPYDNNSKILEESFIIDNYPLAYSYLLSRMEELNSRDKGKVENYDAWYAYGRRQGLLKNSNGIRILLPLTFLKTRGIHYILIPKNEEVLNLSGILLDVKEDKFDEFIKVITSDNFYNYCEVNNKTLSDKSNSNDVWLSLTTTSIKNYLY